MSSDESAPRRFRLFRPQPSDVADARCPECQGEALVLGTLDGHGHLAFYPLGLRFFTIRRVSVRIARAPKLPRLASLGAGRGLQACVDCGLTWTHVDPAELRAAIEQSGKAKTREILKKVGRSGPSD